MRNASGTTLIEIAVALPFMLGIVAFIIFLIFAGDERLALTQAVIKGGRAAHTRADPFKVRLSDGGNLVGLLPGLSVGNLMIENEATFRANHPDLYPLFYHNLESPGQYQTYYSSTGNHPTFGGVTTTGKVYGTSLAQMHPTFRYAIAFVHGEMRSMLGNRVRYPCDPNGTGPDEGPGCLLCYFRNPTILPPDEACICTRDEESFYCQSGDQGACSVSELIPENVSKHFYLTCSYRPSSTVTNFTNAFLRAGDLGEASTTNVVFTRNKLLDVRTENYVGIFGD